MKFEYRVIDSDPARDSTDQIQDFLNKVGSEGWELVSTFLRQNQLTRFIFKKTESHGLQANP